MTRQRRGTRSQGDTSIAIPFAAAILFVWIVVAMVSLYTHDAYELSIVTPVMLLAAGFVFGIRRWRNDDDSTVHPPDESR